jgi:hypothetical protein
LALFDPVYSPLPVSRDSRDGKRALAARCTAADGLLFNLAGQTADLKAKV